MNNPLADMLAQQGRKGDTQVGHLTPGELIIPDAILNSIPGLADMVAQAFAKAGADIEQYRVGGEGDSINPATGVPEYGYDDGGYGSESNPGGGVSGSDTGGFGSAGGDYGPSSDGGWGPSSEPSAPGAGMDYGAEFGTTPTERAAFGKDYGLPGAQNMGGGSYSYDPNTRGFSYNDGFGAPKESFGGMNFFGLGIGERTNPFTNQTQHVGTFNPGSLIGGLVGGALGPLGGMAGGYLGGKMTDTRYGNFADPRGPNFASSPLANHLANLGR